MNGGWTFGILIGVPFLLIVLICGVVIAALLLREKDNLGWAFLIGTPILVLVLAVWTLWPFSKEYHYWTPVEGTVETVDRRQVVDGKGMSEKIVVRFEGDTQLYGIEDTRAALLKPGDKTALLCKKAHQWGPSVDGYDCRWGE